MQKTILLLAFIAQCTFAQTNFYTTVTNLWYQGYKTNVLQMAEQRLAVNSNDIAGLLLKVEYSFATIDTLNISNDINNVISCLQYEYNTDLIFQNYTNSLCSGLISFLEYLTLYEADDIDEDRRKGMLHNKKLIYQKYFKALDDDGYFDVNEATNP